ncbi:MAG TPA: coproporphyrinogen III oxidase family protein [Chloroflexus aurantiacus]|jgi:oxygen-independent coproporphyrinogen-3 oxidase|uniref:Heme chaperone HemW n=1 Tax=Chloroflexus aurantiacus (strain ATCC 29366 / DSM 635 / J-10-fl) TaxID=324602 RepID=A9WC69_CHLAA|nr:MULTISPECIES: radical SAM family heme chaperone HemW [Chloroflexus]ABY33462.1 oxygen-independent coproporphyrinogen III oxidase [Chloroflexus aurantiacus J-10-fl]RMG46353.1 MAG: radical SAM family heme chaperone HemW [Chloroflexota bacterium]GIV92853.1 MAG: coproporphyrinogen III oxidase [Chloroflexus sp.]HBW67499.1 coproporphyrinogen III oxidase family protein [Chloroflexus aurantiacus]
MRHLYLHIPFCHRRCSYCDFNTYANMEHRIEAYVDALCQELAMLRDQLPPLPASPEAAALRPSIFFGGGTPSMLSPAQIERILQAAAEIVPLTGAEISLEANPGTVLGRDYLRDLRSLGINRLSMGVQSLHDPTLRMLGRIHTAAEAYASFNDARAVGFESINLDFIFGLPGQDIEQWRATLTEIIRWEVDHIALYSLILEENTPLYAQVTAGRLQIPDDDLTGAMYELAMEMLGAAGYRHYEISNWVRPSVSDRPDAPPALACQHNLAYWLNSDYLAAGAGAHGHVFPQRYANLRPIDSYITAVQSGRRPIAETTLLTSADLAAETMFMGLRLDIGVGFAHFAARVGQSLLDYYGPTLEQLSQQGLIECSAQRVYLTPRGRMLGNQVFAHFV